MIAAVLIPVVTPVHDEPTPESVADRLRGLAEVAPAIATSVLALDAKGWEMIKPEAVNDGEAFVDVVIAFFKDFPNEFVAEHEARECVPRGHRFNADLGWNVNRDHPGGPTHIEAAEWWSEL